MPATGDRITKRKDGLFQGMYTAQTPEGPKRKYVYGRRYSEVQKKLAEAMGDVARGIVFDDKNLTVGEYLDRFLEDVQRGSVRESTYSRDKYLLTNHVKPALGRVKLRNLSAMHLQRLYRDKLDAAKGYRLEALYVLAVHTGMRRGELLGLKWSDVDLEGGTVSVRRTLMRTGNGKGVALGDPKTKRSRRTVRLTREATEALRGHLEHQLRQIEEAGDHYRDEGLVFATEAGTLINPSNLRQRSFAPLLKKAGLPRACASTTCATPPPRCFCPGASTPSSCRSFSGTPPLPSPSTPTRTPCPAWATRPPPRWRTPSPSTSSW
jgi:integrase